MLWTLAAVLLWLGVAALAVASFRLLRSWSVHDPAPGAGDDALSVVVAAHDEAPRIGALIASLLAQDHPRLEIIVVDDRSRDDTGEVARRAAERDPRVRILRVDRRPSGWQGRLYAQSVGARAASGEWLVFLSADQRLARKDLLRGLVAEYRRRGVAAVSVIGPFVGDRWWQRWAFQPIVNNPVFWGGVFALQQARTRGIWLIGALGMRRETYFALGGAGAAAGCAAGGYDDHGWARALGARGLRGCMLYASALEDACNWDDAATYWAAIRRWGAGLFTYRRGGWLAAAAVAAMIVAVIGGTLELLVDLARGRAPDLAATALAAVGPTIGYAHTRWNREPAWRALGFVGVGPLALALLAGSAWARLRNRVRWRDEEMQIVCARPSEGVSRAGAALDTLPPISRSESGS